MPTTKTGQGQQTGKGETGKGGRTESGAPLTESGHIDRRTKAGQKEEKQETGRSRHEEGSRKGGKH